MNVKKINPHVLLIVLCSLLHITCASDEKKKHSDKKPQIKNEQLQSIPPHEHTLLVTKPDSLATPTGMVWVPGAKFAQGAVAQDKMAMDHEKPAIEVMVDGFFMDATEVTNAQFKTFVEATGYVTVAERALDWEELKDPSSRGYPKTARFYFKTRCVNL